MLDCLQHAGPESRAGFGGGIEAGSGSVRGPKPYALPNAFRAFRAITIEVFPNQTRFRALKLPQQPKGVVLVSKIAAGRIHTYYYIRALTSNGWTLQNFFIIPLVLR